MKKIITTDEDFHLLSDLYEKNRPLSPGSFLFAEKLTRQKNNYGLTAQKIQTLTFFIILFILGLARNLLFKEKANRNTY